MRKTIILATLLLCLTSWTNSQTDRRWVRHPDNGFDIWVSGTDHEHRAATRLFYWSRGRSRGEVFIGYGPADWDPKFEAGIESLRYGYTWRMASGFWTTLDTNLELRLGDQLIPSGTHYLGLKRSLDGVQWFLAVLDPAVVRAARIDAFETTIRPVPTRFEIPMQFERAAEVEPHLKVRLDASDDDPTAAALRISFGPYRLGVPITLAEMPKLGDWSAVSAALAGPQPQFLAGSWAARVQSERGEYDLVVTLAWEDNELVGFGEVEAWTVHGLRLADLTLDGSNIRFRVPSTRDPLDFTGTFDRDGLQGAYLRDGQQVSTAVARVAGSNRSPRR